MVTRYLPRKPAPAVPAALPVARALAAHTGLALLTQMARDAQARLQTVQSLVPAALRPSLRAGAVDEDGWTLLVTSASAAAKLRQLRPHLESALLHRHGPGELRIKLASH